MEAVDDFSSVIPLLSNVETSDKRSELINILNSIFQKVMLQVPQPAWISEHCNIESYVENTEVCIKKLFSIIYSVTVIQNDDFLLSICYRILTCFLHLKCQLHSQVFGRTATADTSLCKAYLFSLINALSKTISSGQGFCEMEFVISTTESFFNSVLIHLSPSNPLQKECELFSLSKAEFYLATQNQEKAILAVKSAKYQIRNYELYRRRLFVLCYEMAVYCNNNEEYARCVLWIHESLDFSETLKDSAQDQAILFEFLGKVYLNWDENHHWDKAADAFDKAFCKNNDPQNLIRILKCALIGRSTYLIHATLQQLVQLHHQDIRLIEIVAELLLKQNNEKTLLDFLQTLENCSISKEWDSFWIVKLKACFNLSDLEEARKSVESCLEYLTSQNPTQKVHIGTQLLASLTSYAGSFIMNGSKVDALPWLQYCTNITSMLLEYSTDLLKTTFSQIQRYLCWCLLEADKMDDATTSLALAVDLDPPNLLGHYLSIRIGIALEDEDTASQAIQQIVKLTDTKADVMIVDDVNDGSVEINGRTAVLYAAKLAWEKGNRNFFVTMLSKVITLTPIQADVDAFFMALKCLLRFYFKETSNANNYAKEIIKYLTMMETCLKTGMEAEYKSTSANVYWAISFCWNAAMNHHTNSRFMFQLLLQSNRFYRLIENTDPTIAVQHKTYLLMAMAAGLHFVRTTTEDDDADKERILQEVLELGNELRKLMAKETHVSLWFLNTLRNKTPIRILLLYEFEAKILLSSTTLEETFEEILRANMDAKSLESVAEISKQGGSQTSTFTSRALQMAIRKHCEVPDVDFEKLSKDYRNLFEVLLRNYEPKNVVSENKLFQLVDEVIEAIRISAGNYPEIEIIWILTRIWNLGIRCFADGNIQSSLKGCNSALTLANHLLRFKDAYLSNLESKYLVLFPGPRE